MTRCGCMCVSPCTRPHVCVCAFLLHGGLTHCHLPPPRSEYSGSPGSPQTLSSYRRDPPATWDPPTLRPDREDRAPPPGGKHHDQDGSQGAASCPGECWPMALGDNFCFNGLEQRVGCSQPRDQGWTPGPRTSSFCVTLGVHR